MECQYCKKVLNNSRALKYHQKSTKSCLIIQGKDTDIYKCKCGTTFSTKNNLLRHQSSCSSQNIIGDLNNQLHEVHNTTRDLTGELQESYNTITDLKNQLQESQSEILNLKNPLQKSKNEILNLKATIENLESKLNASEKINEHYFKLTDTLARKDTTTTNNISNTIIEHLKPLDMDKLCDYSNNLSLEHIQGGAEGYAKYAMEYPLKDKLLCSDYSRRICKYKNKEEQIITDPEMVILLGKFCESIRDKNQELTEEYLATIKEKYGESETNQLVKDIVGNNRDIKNGSLGESSEFTRYFVKNICAKTVKNEAI